jgi:all-trans-8'-apo-beta-carotenal 15,15'-oxygenase
VVHRAELRMPDLLWTRQLNAMDWSTEGRSDPTVHHTVHQGFRPEAITQEMLALYGDRVDRTLMPPTETTPKVVTTALPDLEVIAVHELAMDDFPTSPIFVPRDPGADPSRSRHAGSQPGGHDGFVVVPILNDDAFRVEVFDAADVGRGPLAVASAPGMHVPFLLHAAWMTTPVTSSPGPGNTFADELDQIGELSDDLADVVLEVARELEEGVPL